ncbi:MAG: hypothetical protein AAFY29_11735 [Pseudomonadota bacterium]
MRLQHILCQLGIITASVSAFYVAASDNAPPQLSAEDRAAIFAVLVERYPEVASSPGIKAAFYAPARAYTDCDTIILGTSAAEHRKRRTHKRGSVNCKAETASIYLYPHAERRGRKDALKAMCQRAVSINGDTKQPSGRWNCPVGTFRQYVQIEGQSCEVRLTGNTSSAALSAARAAGMQAIRAFGQPAPEALVMFTHTDEDYAWGMFGTDACGGGMVVEFLRVSDADPRSAADWKATVRPNNKIMGNPAKAERANSENARR